MIIKPGENKLVRIEAPFTAEISSLAIVKLLDKLTQSIIMLKVKFLRNTAMLDITLILNPEEAIGILDLRSLGYYKIKQGVIQQNLSRYYKKGTHLSVTIKEIQTGYLSSSYFKDIYLYLVQNKLPSYKTPIRKIIC